VNDTTGQTTGTVEHRADAEGKSTPEAVSSKFWQQEIEGAKKREDKWRKRARKVLNRYKDERDDRRDGDERRANILWSNTEVLKSALFQGLDKPDVRRRFPGSGQNDRASRTAALVLERAASYSHDVYDADSPFEAAVEDMVLPARGTVWVEYDAQVDGDAISHQEVRHVYVYWEDYLCSAGRTEAMVWWRARRHYYSRDELNRYFPDHGEKIPLNAVSETWSDAKGKPQLDDTFKRACVWEIWDKTKRERIWFAEDYDWLLKVEPDPLKLSDFFPCPPPLYGHRTNDSLIPTPEYLFYQDQALELDEIATRLHRMVGNLKRRGVYDASMEGADNQLSQLARAGDNVFLPYKGFAALMEKGGLRGVFQSEDLAPIVAVIQGLSDREQRLLAKIYDITGISDILRGSSNANETATAQNIKAQFGSLRLVRRQKRVKDFVKAALRIQLEIIAEHFTRETLAEMTGVAMPLQMEVMQARQQIEMLAQQEQQGVPVPPEMRADLEATAKAVAWEDVEAILRSDKRRGYSVDIETDATAKMENDEQKAARIEFVTSMFGMLERVVPAIMTQPALAPLAKELTMFGARTFKIGRALEDTFDDAFDQMAKQAQAMAQQAQGQGPPPDPKAEAEAEHIKAKTQAVLAQAETDKAERTQAMQFDAFEQQRKTQEAAMKQAADARKANTDAAIADTKRKTAEVGLAASMVKLEQAAMPPAVGPM